MREAHPHPWALPVSLVLGGLLALGLLLGRSGPAPLVGSGADGGTAGLPPGSRAPAFTLPDAAGEKVSLSAWQGQPLHVLLVTAGCPHCQAAVAALAQAPEVAPPHLLVIAAAGPEEALQLHRQLGATYPVLVDTTRGVLAAYQVPGVPALYELDAAGRVERLVVGMPAVIRALAVAPPNGAAPCADASRTATPAGVCP